MMLPTIKDATDRLRFLNLCRHECCITHVHYALVVNKKFSTGCLAIILVSQLHNNKVKSL